MIVQTARPQDINSWLCLAGEVEHLFGPMVEEPGFLAALKCHIQRESAFCIRNHDGPPITPLLAGLLFSRHPPQYKIGWLAVAERVRRRRCGRCLLEHALTRVEPPAEVSVVTFGPDNPEGVAARRFYEAFGFTAGEWVDPGPEGGSRQVFRLMIEK